MRDIGFLTISFITTGAIMGTVPCWETVSRRSLLKREKITRNLSLKVKERETFQNPSIWASQKADR